MTLNKTFFSVFVFALLLPPSLGQVAPVHVTPSAKAMWDHDGKDVAGAAEALDVAELALTLPDVDLSITNSWLVMMSTPCLVGSNVASIANLLAGRQSGAYKVWCRVKDKAGNASGWALPVDIILDTSSPTPPRNLGCQAR